MESIKSSKSTSMQQRRELIVTSAIDCFIKKGFHQTSVRDIAKQANISLGNFYNYFDSKETLIKEIANLEAAELSWIDELSNKDLPSLDSLNKFVNKYLDYVEQLPNVILTVEILAESIRDADIGESFERNRRKLISHLSKILASGIKTGQFNADIDKKEISEIILDMIEGLAMRSALAEKKSSKKSRKALHTMIYNAICN